MFRRLITGTAMAGALTLAVAAAAGAAPAGPTGGAGTSATAAAGCARLPRIEFRLHTFEGRVAARIPKAEAREAKAKAAGHTKLADAIAKRITRVQDRENRLNARLAEAEVNCGTTSAPPDVSVSPGASGISGNTGTTAG